MPIPEGKTQTTIVLTDETYRNLEAYAKRRKWTKSQVVEEALWSYLFDEKLLDVLLLGPDVRDKFIAAMRWSVGAGKKPKEEDFEKLRHAYQAVK